MRVVLRTQFAPMGAGVLLLAGLAFAGCAQLGLGNLEASSPANIVGWTSNKDSVPPPAATPLSTKPSVAEVKPARKTVAASEPKTVVASAPPNFKPAAAPQETACGQGPGCVSKLRALMDEPDRSWMRQPETPTEFASGVRLFAYRGLRAKLTCTELTVALEDIEGSAKTFDNPIQGVKAEQVTRAKALSSQVREELRAESAQRCGPDSPKSSGGAAQG